MDFEAFRNKVREYINKLYQGYSLNVNSMNEFSNVQSLLDYEKIKLENYIFTINKELRYQIEEALLKHYTNTEVEKMLQGKFNGIVINPMEIQEEQVVREEIISLGNIVNQTKEESNSGIRYTAIIGGGSAIGWALGAVLHKMMLGTMIGALATTALVMMDSKKSKVEQEDVTEEMTKIKQVFDKKAFLSLLDKRREVVIKQIVNYINEIETYFNIISRG